MSHSLPLKAVYAGSFDPITLGHLDLIVRGSKLFDELVVGIGHNHRKKYLFSLEERTALVEQEVERVGLQNVKVRSFQSMLIQFAEKENAQVILRGLRAATDFDFEFQMGLVNMDLHPKIETFFLLSNPENIFISSSAVREIAYFGGDTSRYVSDHVRTKMDQQFQKSKED